ncbi:hypothetical protein D3C78_1719970 [compost metagenome]
MQLLDGVQEYVDGDIVDLLQLAFQLLAERAIRVLEHGDLALAVAPDDLDRLLERQLVEADLGQHFHALGAQALPGLGIDQIALDRVADLFIDIE